MEKFDNRLVFVCVCTLAIVLEFPVLLLCEMYANAGEKGKGVIIFILLKPFQIWSYMWAAFRLKRAFAAS